MKRAVVAVAITLAVVGGGTTYALTRKDTEPVQHETTATTEVDTATPQAVEEVPVETVQEPVVEQTEPVEEPEPEEVLTHESFIDSIGLTPEDPESSCYVSLLIIGKPHHIDSKDVYQVADEYEYAMEKYGSLCKALGAYSAARQQGNPGIY